MRFLAAFPVGPLRSRPAAGQRRHPVGSRPDRVVDRGSHGPGIRRLRGGFRPQGSGAGRPAADPGRLSCADGQINVEITVQQRDVESLYVEIIRIALDTIKSGQILKRFQLAKSDAKKLKEGKGKVEFSG